MGDYSNLRLRLARTAYATIATLGMLTGCGGDPGRMRSVGSGPSGTAPPLSPPSPSPPSPPLPSPPLPSPSPDLAGSVWYRSDVATLPDQPVPSGTVIVVPTRAAAAFWSAAGLPATGPTLPRRAEITIDAAALPAGVAAVPVLRGRFESRGTGTDVLLCLSDSTPGDDPGTPYRISGCAPYRGGAAGAHRIRLTIGLEGVTIDGPA